MRQLATLLIPLVFALGACTKETDEPEKKEPIEPFFIKASVSGNTFSAVDSNISFTYSPSFRGVDGQQGLSVSFVNKPEVKTYVLNSKASEREVYVSWKENFRSECPSHLIYSGELQVTSHVDGKIRGTFKGSAKTGGLIKPESEVEITDGSFFVYLPN